MAGVFLSAAYLEKVKSRAQRAGSPWAKAYEHLLTEAGEALEQAPLSVRQNGGSPWFRQDGAYIEGRDGVRNTEANHKSGELAGRLSRSCYALALAWRLTDEAKYADKAIKLIHAWCINRDTYMFPTGGVVDAATKGGVFGGDIIVFAHFNDLFLAVHLLNDYAGWELYAHAAVRRWIRSMVDAQREVMFFDSHAMYNNWEDARLLYLAKGALALGDLDLLVQVFDRWRHILPIKMREDGELHRETMRTRSMHYTLFALDSTTQVAEIARQSGVDLYDYEVNGKTLKLAVDYAAHYLLHMEEWPFQMIEPMQGKGEERSLEVFEMAHGRWQDARYMEIIEKYGGRPVKGRHATLLCGIE